MAVCINSGGVTRSGTRDFGGWIMKPSKPPFTTYRCSHWRRDPMHTWRGWCSHRRISCGMHRLSAALRCLSALHDTLFLMPLPAATPMHSPVRLHPEAPSTRALMPTRISASPPPIASSKERPALEDHEPGVSATRRRRAPERAQTSKALLRKVSRVRKRAPHRERANNVEIAIHRDMQSRMGSHVLRRLPRSVAPVVHH